MRVSREKANESRELVINMAARLLRERGFDGIGVADIMKAAGMTHGGFYRHFESKDELAIKASERAIADTKASIIEEFMKMPEDPLRVLVERYVSSVHCGDPGSGCILPSLAADAARRDDPALRQVFTANIKEYLEQLGVLLAARSEATDSRSPAAVLAEMVGAVILSRVISDEALRDSLMADVVRDIVGK